MPYHDQRRCAIIFESSFFRGDIFLGLSFLSTLYFWVNLFQSAPVFIRSILPTIAYSIPQKYLLSHSIFLRAKGVSSGDRTWADIYPGIIFFFPFHILASNFEIHYYIFGSKISK